MEIEKGELITLENNKEYVCFGRATAENGKNYVYLMTTSEPVEICFGEEIVEGEGVRVRILGTKEENQIAVEAFKKNMV